MILDTMAGTLCGAVAVGAFSIHVISSRERRNWMTIPQYVRRGILLCGIMFTWRSVNFFSIAEAPGGLGHINAEGMMALVVFAYTIWAIAIWQFRAQLPAKSWERIQWVEAQTRANPDLTPILMPMDEIVSVARATGAGAVGPGEGPEVVGRETARMNRNRHHVH